jgi:hypothetical protein
LIPLMLGLVLAFGCVGVAFSQYTAQKTDTKKKKKKKKAADTTTPPAK